jgi:hypothetical protein
MNKHHTRLKAKKPSKSTFQPLHGGLEMIHSSSSNKKVVGRKLNKQRQFLKWILRYNKEDKKPLLEHLENMKPPKWLKNDLTLH